MAMCKKNDYKCGNLLEEALLQNRDDAEDDFKVLKNIQCAIELLTHSTLQESDNLNQTVSQTMIKVT
jgi:hypothetical protein